MSKIVLLRFYAWLLFFLRMYAAKSQLRQYSPFKFLVIIPLQIVYILCLTQNVQDKPSILHIMIGEMCSVILSFKTNNLSFPLFTGTFRQ